MPVWKVYRHGMTAGTPPSRNNHVRGIRGDVGGWSKSSTRSNTRFLYSVDERELTGHGFALSLTIRECPPTADDWKRVREAFAVRMRRMGMVRMHWLTEWQKRGVPHMHAAVWFDDELAQRDPFALRTIKEHWLAVASAYGAGEKGQHVALISDSLGWFKYLAKHAVRGLGHYQRSNESVPAGWQKTGRMWGHLGDWPVGKIGDFYVDDEGHFRGRRIFRRWAIANARAEVRQGKSLRSRITWARGMLRCNEHGPSRLRGLNDWVPLEVSSRVLVWLLAEGHQVDPRQPKPKKGRGDADGDGIAAPAAETL